jgi:hypothetical protein
MLTINPELTSAGVVSALVTFTEIGTPGACTNSVWLEDAGQLADPGETHTAVLPA